MHIPYSIFRCIYRQLNASVPLERSVSFSLLSRERRNKFFICRLISPMCATFHFNSRLVRERRLSQKICIHFIRNKTRGIYILKYLVNEISVKHVATIGQRSNVVASMSITSNRGFLTRRIADVTAIPPDTKVRGTDKYWQNNVKLRYFCCISSGKLPSLIKNHSVCITGDSGKQIFFNAINEAAIFQNATYFQGLRMV